LLGIDGLGNPIRNGAMECFCTKIQVGPLKQYPWAAAGPSRKYSFVFQFLVSIFDCLKL
jgi:hypothetical protein